MTFPLFLFGLFVIVAVVLLVVPGINRIPAAIVAVFAVLALVWSVTTQVPARSIGIVTSFGKPVDALDSGLHLKAPWQKVSDLDGRKQVTNFGGPKSDEYNTVTVRLGSEGSAEVQASVVWSITTDREGATALYSDYDNMSKIEESVVARQTRASISDIFGSFNPLEALEPKDNAKSATNPPSKKDWADQIKASLEESAGQYVNIDSVIVQYVGYDKGTQSKLNKYAQEVAETRVAEQKIQTTQAQAKANRVLSSSISNDPNVLVKQCLDSLEKIVDKGHVPPAGFSCWPGAGNVAGLIVDK